MLPACVLSEAYLRTQAGAACATFRSYGRKLAACATFRSYGRKLAACATFRSYGRKLAACATFRSYGRKLAACATSTHKADDLTGCTDVDLQNPVELNSASIQNKDGGIMSGQMVEFPSNG